MGYHTEVPLLQEYKFICLVTKVDFRAEPRNIDLDTFLSPTILKMFSVACLSVCLVVRKQVAKFGDDPALVEICAVL